MASCGYTRPWLSFAKLINDVLAGAFSGGAKLSGWVRAISKRR